MRAEKTNRGFCLIKFSDRNGVECSLQKSSIATEDCIWLGCDDANPRVLVPGQGWRSMVMPEGYLADTRMHLTRKQVKRLIPHLVTFVETGEIREAKT